MSEERCGNCEYFVAFRNYNYEKCTNDTITEYCELLQNKETYDRNKGDEIWNGVFIDCPLKTGYVSTESAILLLNSKKEVRKQFDNYVRISCEGKKKLQDENEQLKRENSAMKEEQNEMIAPLKKQNEQLHHLKVLANAFIVEKGLELEFVKWCKEDE